MTIQVIKYDKFLVESCGIHLWSCHQTVRVRKDKVHVKSVRINDRFVKPGTHVILKASEIRVLTASEAELHRFKTGKNL